ncbi:hypothetical protein [Nocardia sp. NBC_01327]|uniref:hypothetical protein n=1 Tax=Nocardia sp. NBC_01327 TaxID=2903593 RepID=UPI002E0E1A74|nr:hypothetical protein OG326_37250 [Nocardia sp. NBC_01327]
MAEQNSGEQNVAPTTEVAPTTVRAAGVLVAVQGAAAVISGIVFAVMGVTGSAHNAKNSYLTAGYAVIVGGAVLAAGLGLWRGRRWGRAIAVITQLLLLGVSWFMVTSDRFDLAVPFAAVAIAGLVLLFAPASNRWMAAGYDLPPE